MPWRPGSGSAGVLGRRLARAALVLGSAISIFFPASALAATGDITTVAGNGFDGYSGDGGPATSASLRAPAGVAFTGGDLFIADFYTHTVRRVNSGGTINTMAGTGTAGFFGDGGAATSAQLNEPADAVTDAAGNVYIADFLNSRVRRVTPLGTISTFAGTGTFGYNGDGGLATAARLGFPAGLELDSAGNLYVTDFGAHVVRRITPAGIISTVAGNGSGGYSGDGGPATSARLDEPGDVAVDGAGNLFIGEFSGHRVRKVSTGGTISTIGGTGSAGYSGDGGPATSAQMSSPGGVDVDSSGNVFVAEFGNNVIRKIDTSGTITRVAGTGFGGFSGDGGPAVSAQLRTPSRVTLSPDGDFYISDWGNHRVRHVEGLGSPDAPILSSTSPASPSASNAPRVIGSAPSGSTVRLYTNATCTSAVAATGTAAQLASPGLLVTVASDSTTTFWGTATDAGGNASGCSTSSITYVEDSTPPGPPTIDSAPPSPGNDATPTWAFSAAGAASYECRLVRGATIISDWAACSSPRTFDLSSQADGTYTFSVRAVDAAGNTGSTSSSSYDLDTAAPAAPSIGSAPPSPGNDASPTWGFSGEAGAAFECRLERGATIVSDWAACSSPRSFDLSAEPDGSYTYSVRARDAAGNTGSAASSTYVFDRVAPAAPSIDSAPTSPGNDVTPSWSFSGEASASFQCQLVRGATVVSDWAACSDPKAYDLSPEADGVYSFSVRATDAAGNTGPATSTSYELDTSAPAAPSIDSAPATPGTDSTPSWSFSGEAGAGFECRLARGAAVVSDWASCSDPRTFDLSGESDGGYTFSVRARDAAGNTGATASSAYDLDRAAPAAPAIDLAPSSPGNSRSPAWGFSGEAGAGFECRLARGATVVSDWAACSSPRMYSLLLEPDGSYTFSVRASDGAGNTSAVSSSAYDLDTTAPGTPTIDASPSSPSNDRTPDWGFSAEAGASLECRLARGATVVSDWASCSSPQAYDLSSEPDGDYQFGVRASDAAGNASGTASSDYTLDAAIPSVPSIDSTPGLVGNDSNPAWGFSGDAGASFECRIERSATVIFDWAACSSPQSFDLTSEPDGSYDFFVRAVRSGERSTPASDSYALDRSAPAAPSIDSAPGSPAADPSPSWSFSGEAGASWECRVSRGATVVSDWAACSSPETADLSAQPDGTYTFAVRGTDAAGNTGAASSSDYDLDTSAPAAPSIDSSPPSPGNAANPAWSFSGEAGASFECRLTRGGATVSAWAACSSPRAHDLSAEPDGTYTFAVRARDAAGNTGPAASSDYILDRTGASVQIDSGPGAAGNDRAPGWTFSAEAGASFECRLERGGSLISDWAACSSPRAFDLSSQPDGTYTFSVRATDSLGNQGAPARADYELDTAAPPAPSIDAEPASPSRDTTPTWAFSAEPGASVECHLEGGGRLVADWGPCSSPRSFNVAGGADGRYTLSVRATDAAGNTGGPASSDFELDTTAPDPPEITSSPGRFGEDVTPVWRFTGEQGATFECSLRLGATAVAGAEPCASPREYDLGREPEGDYTISLRARDAAGNLSVARTDDYELRSGGEGDEPGGDDSGNRGDGGARPRPPDTEAPDPAGAASGGGLEPGRPPADDERGKPSPGGDGGSVGEGIAGKLDTPEPGAAPAGGEGGSPVLKALSKAAKAVARHAGKSVFPSLLIAMVLCFVAVQNRIDRNDPKLGLAPVFADPDLTFDPPLKKQ